MSCHYIVLVLLSVLFLQSTDAENATSFLKNYITSFWDGCDSFWVDMIDIIIAMREKGEIDPVCVDYVTKEKDPTKRAEDEERMFVEYMQKENVQEILNCLMEVAKNALKTMEDEGIPMEEICKAKVIAGLEN